MLLVSLLLSAWATAATVTTRSAVQAEAELTIQLPDSQNAHIFDVSAAAEGAEPSDFCKFTLDGWAFDFCTFSLFRFQITRTREEETPPTITRITSHISLTGELLNSRRTPEEERCPKGTWICIKSEYPVWLCSKDRALKFELAVHIRVFRTALQPARKPPIASDSRRRQFGTGAGSHQRCSSRPKYYTPIW